MTDTNTVGGDRHAWEAEAVLDYDELVDRNEELHLLQAHHHLAVNIDGGQDATPSTQYGVALVSVEISASPAISNVTLQRTGAGGTPTIIAGSPQTENQQDDSIDLIGRPLEVNAGQDFSDSSTGVGGASGEATDDYVGSMFPEELGAFHPRDELFYNGEIRLWNMDVAGILTEVTCQHVYGVVES